MLNIFQTLSFFEGKDNDTLRIHGRIFTCVIKWAPKTNPVMLFCLEFYYTFLLVAYNVTLASMMVPTLRPPVFYKRFSYKRLHHYIHQSVTGPAEGLSFLRNWFSCQLHVFEACSIQAASLSSNEFCLFHFVLFVFVFPHRTEIRIVMHR